MPSIITHAVGAYFVNQSIFAKETTWKIALCVVVSAMIPDADFIGFKLGIPYDSLFGHRGFTHSFVFALLWSIMLYVIFFYQKINPFLIITILFIATISHPVLDAMTSGGEGVAFFSPFSNHRYFFPYRPIKVSPLGISRFFSERGFLVLKSEILFVWIPSFALFLVAKYIRWVKAKF